jgi:hypothetical protein
LRIEQCRSDLTLNFVEKLRCVLQIAVITTVGFGVSYRAVGILKSFALGSLLGGAQVARSFGFVGTYALLDSILYASAEYLDGLLSRARREETLPVLQ